MVGFFTDNGWKNVIFSFVMLVFTAGIAIGYAIFTKKNKVSCKKYSLIVFFHFLAAAVLFIACSGLFARVSEIVSAGVIVAAVLAVYLCYLCREKKIVGLLIRFRADIIIVAVLIAAVYFFLPFSVLKAENPYFQIKITVWRALDTIGTVGTIPLFLLLLCSVHVGSCEHEQTEPNNIFIVAAARRFNGNDLQSGGKQTGGILRGEYGCGDHTDRGGPVFAVWSAGGRRNFLCPLQVFRKNA